MTTEKQIQANRENAQLGGVKTEEGKEITRLNAIRHGFFSHIVTEYDKINQKDFCQEMYDLFRPANIYEEQLVEILLSNTISYRRICMVESNLIAKELNKIICSKENVLEDFDDTRYQTKFKEYLTDELLKFQRYKTSAVNLITKMQHELERLGRIRKGEPVPSPAVYDINILTK